LLGLSASGFGASATALADEGSSALGAAGVGAALVSGFAAVSTEGWGSPMKKEQEALRQRKGTIVRFFIGENHACSRRSFLPPCVL